MVLALGLSKSSLGGKGMGGVGEDFSPLKWEEKRDSSHYKSFFLLAGIWTLLNKLPDLNLSHTSIHSIYSSGFPLYLVFFVFIHLFYFLDSM